MKTRASLRCRIASEPGEFEQIFRLNHRTFVEEIPQHGAKADGRLIDRFHAENTYVIAKEGDRVVGMLAVRDRRPFSLDEKLGPIDRHLPRGCRPCEVRLLAVEPGRRQGVVLRELLARLRELARERGYDVAAISGTVRQLRLYRHLGAVPFGPLVGTERARYQPMYIALTEFEAHAGRALARGKAPLNFLPGPVAIPLAVQRAFAAPPISHRCARYRSLRQRVESDLCRLTGATHASVLLGSGTLGNDVVAAQLSMRPGPGAILVHGEFGERLTDHARRFGMRFHRVEGVWGRRFTRAEIDRALTMTPRPRWLWTALCETSTGSLEDLALLRERCAAHDTMLCLDAVSAIGAVPVDLRGVEFATAVSGKALAAYPGLAIVLHADVPAPAPDRLPRYLDLGHHIACDGVPFTQSSNLLAALAVALEGYATERPFRELEQHAVWLRSQLRRLGLRIVVPDEQANPAVTTIACAPGAAASIGDALAARGILVSYQSGYLQQRDWLQVCLMGELDRSRSTRLLEALATVVAQPCSPVSARSQADLGAG